MTFYYKARYARRSKTRAFQFSLVTIPNASLQGGIPPELRQKGPRTGTATFTINRAAFGRNGGRLLAFFNWLTLVGWDSSGVALMVIALLTLTHVVGWSIGDTTWFKVAVIVFVAAV